jgi:hypothetical protein
MTAVPDAPRSYAEEPFQRVQTDASPSITDLTGQVALITGAPQRDRPRNGSGPRRFGIVGFMVSEGPEESLREAAAECRVAGQGAPAE